MESLGRLTVIREEAEVRLWIYEVSELLDTEPARSGLEQLRLMQEQIHPLFHRALLALIAATDAGKEPNLFGAVFEQAWTEAVVTADEIEGLLARRP